MAKQIDPIYKQYTSRVIKYLASTEFYDYFMAVMESGKNTFQFSNRKVEKTVDEAWVMAIEAVIKPMEEIIANPRNFIIQEEVIVNVALAKKVTPDSIRHLAQHGNMIDNVTEDSVRPNRLMNKFKEDSWNTYENRFVYTLLEMAWEFVDKRYEAIFAAIGEEFGAFLKMDSKMKTYHESIDASIDLRIQQEEDMLSADEKNETIFSRIARLHRILGMFRQTNFAQEVSKYGKIKPPLVRTNAIAKNPNYKACHKLWNFIIAYKDVGYKINIYEQSTVIDEAFTRDIYHSILFNYIILKNYLEDPKDRDININKKYKKKSLKPRFIKEIIEEIVKNYDMPDVEIRKVLVEEITKAQLMKEEEAERMRLVEEKEKEMREKKRQEDLEKARLAKEAEKERQRLLREEEKERIRLQKEEEARKLREEKEKERLEQLDIQRGILFRKEIEETQAYIATLLENRQNKIEEEARLQVAAQAEKERLAKEKEKARAKAAREKAAQIEKARIAKEKEKARIKAARERAEQAEKEKIAREKEKARIKAAREKAAKAEKEKMAREHAKKHE